MSTEQEQFLDELKDDKNILDILDKPLIPEQEEKREDVDPENAPESVKDRRHRRLEQKLQAEREANIAMAARLETLAESTKVATDAEYLKSVERIYGTDTPEAQAATEILKNALLGVKQEARDEALQTFRQEMEQSSQEVAKESQTLDAMVEELEDEHGVTLTPEVQKGFFTLLERLSPKDRDGNVIEYADHHAVWDEYQERLKRKPDNRAKELSARSMIQGASGSDSKIQQSAEERFLKEHGII